MTAIPSWLQTVIVGSALFAVTVGCSGEQDHETDKQAQPAARAAEQQSVPPVSPAPVTSESTADSPAEQLRQYIDLPDYYPTDAPIYPGTRPSEVQQTPEGRVTAVFGTEDSSEQVAAYLHEALPGQGWTLTVEQAMDDGLILQAIKPDRLLSVLLSRFAAGEGKELTIIAIAVDK